MSVAGKRAGLAGARSGLFMEQIRVIKEMREADARRGRTGNAIRPRFMVWENVPGAFSSNKGDDFRAVLEETIRVADPDAPDVPLPPKGKWPLADCWMGDGWSIAYRVLDAQFWGVPQRRRRIALVADFGGHAAPEILFVRQSVCGDIETGGAPGEEAAARTGGGAETPSAICAGFKHKAGSKAGSVGFARELAPTFSAEQTSAVYVHQNQLGEVRTGAVTGTLSTNSNATGRNAPLVFDARGNGDGKTAIAVRQHRFDEYREGVAMLTAGTGTRHTGETLVVTGVDCRNLRENGDLCGTLQAKATGGYSLNYIHPVRIGGEVRRLTPLECERLQGYPDGWTDIGDWADSKGKTHKRNDSARCTALGNSIALPPWAWLLKRLCGCYERTVTMASLFDGIGGFPLIWERLNGPGSCLWASEIEEFPIAVTKKRFRRGKEER